MRRAVALLATLLALAGAAGCGEEGAEPGAPKGATLVLDFSPNAVHTGIYSALGADYYEEAGVELEVQPPGESSDAPKLLAAGRADFAILDIHDLGIARERGIDLVGIAPIVRRPLASVISRADGPVWRPRDLEGRRVGVTGLPSDEAVVNSMVAADGGDPAEVEKVTIGFTAVASLAAGEVDAATGFWNSEAVALERQGVPVRTLKVDRFGAPPYPELVLTTSRKLLDEDPELVETVVAETRRGYALALHDPKAALDTLLAAEPALERAEQARQLRLVGPILHPGPFNRRVLRDWAAWDRRHGLLRRPLDVGEAFLPLSPQQTLREGG